MCSSLEYRINYGIEVTTMNYQDSNVTEVENVGMIDSVVRGSLSVAILVSVLLIPAISSTTLIGLTLAAIYTGLTAFIGWDPFYALMNKSRTEPQIPVPPTVSAHPHNAEQAPGSGHKKAA